MIRAIRPISDRERFELLALRLGVHGPTAATAGVVQRLMESPLWLETRSLLREHGFTEAEMAQLIGVHPLGCPCWSCVRRLRFLVQQHQDKMRRKYKAKRKPPVGL